MVPPTAHAPGRKLGRVGWRKPPETKAQGSTRRQLPGGGHTALCRLGHRPRAGAGPHRSLRARGGREGLFQGCKGRRGVATMTTANCALSLKFPKVVPRA